MNVKKILLSLDRNALTDRYYDEYYKNNEIKQAEAKLENIDLVTAVANNVKCFLDQIAEIEPVENDIAVIVAKYCDFDFEGKNLEMVFKNVFDAFSVEMPIADVGERRLIKNISEAKNKPIFKSLGLSFLDWSEILGYDVLYTDDDIYGCAACIINEMTWFGYDKDVYQSNKDEEIKRLDEIEDEIKSGTAEFVSIDDIFAEFKLIPQPPETKAKKEAMLKIINVENYNKNIRIYNLLRAEGKLSKKKI